MGEAEGRQEKDEAGRPGGGAPGGLPRPVESDGLAVPSIEPAPLLTAPEGEAGASARNKPLWREYAEAIAIAIVLALFIRTFVVQAFKIPSGSMVPTLTIGDHILVSKMSYGLQWPTDCKFGEWFRIGAIPVPALSCHTSHYIIPFGSPQRGDVIVFRFPAEEDKDFIKRVVGLPGDSVEVRNKRVWINGELLVETYPQFVDQALIPPHARCKATPTAMAPHHNECRDNIGPWKVPENSYLVMGDNRDQSMDSRFWGFVKLEKIKGKAFLIYWSWNGQGSLSKWVRWERLGKAIR